MPQIAFSLTDVLLAAYEHLAQRAACPEVVSIGGRRFIGVRSDQRGALNLLNLRRMICQELGLNDGSSKIVQIVGDSGTAFDDARILSAQEALTRIIESDSCIEYGFTSIKHDANWLVQDYISSRPEAAIRTIANVVGQSIETLRSADWTGSEHVTTFAMLYNQDGPLTSFGQDNWLSDGIMAAEFGDRMLCFEGGPQAFHQCVNALLRGIEVIAMTDLRSGNDEGRFSAVRLLLLFTSNDKGVELDQRLKESLNAYPPRKEEQLLAIHRDLVRIKQCEKDVSKLISEYRSAE